MNQASRASAAAPGIAADPGDLPLPDTIPHVLLRAAAARPDHPAIVDGTRVLTYADVRGAMMDLAAALVGAGMRKGDRAGIWLPNSAEWMIVCMGVQAAGGVIVPLNTRLKGQEVSHMLGKAGRAFCSTPKPLSAMIIAPCWQRWTFPKWSAPSAWMWKPAVRTS